MGVLDFDTTKWKNENEALLIAKPAKLAKDGAETGELSQLSQLSQLVGGENCFSEQVAGLANRPPPRAVKGWLDVWSRVVADAQWLVNDGWAERALLLGWEPLHLFGIRPDEDSDARPGIAVWLNGSRHIGLMDERSAITRVDDLRRCFNCRSTDGAVFLWDLT